jgi:hypothetical protein
MLFALHPHVLGEEIDEGADARSKMLMADRA